jgi:hypothetical protein
MSEKIKVRIDMDQVFWWDIVSAADIAKRSELFCLPPELAPELTMKIDKSLFDEYEKLLGMYRDIQDKLEQLYRVQEGLAPWASTPVPDYTKLE